MQEAWIIDTTRSPRGLGHPDKGSLAGIHPQRLLSQVLAALGERNLLDRQDIEHVFMGCGNPAGTQRGDIARRTS